MRLHLVGWRARIGVAAEHDEGTLDVASGEWSITVCSLSVWNGSGMKPLTMNLDRDISPLR
jgi:hypothetical protein